MKSSEILRKAARLVECKKEDYSCCAIYYAVKGRFLRNPRDAALNAVMDRFQPLYFPNAPFKGDMFWAGHKDDPGKSAWTRDDRVIALCLAAAIAEDKGD